MCDDTAHSSICRKLIDDKVYNNCLPDYYQIICISIITQTQETVGFWSVYYKSALSILHKACRR